MFRSEKNQSKESSTTKEKIFLKEKNIVKEEFQIPLQEYELLNTIANHFTNWNNNFTVVKAMQSYHPTGNYGEIKQYNMKLLKKDLKLKVNYFGRISPLDLMCVYKRKK